MELIRENTPNKWNVKTSGIGFDPTPLLEQLVDKVQRLLHRLQVPHRLRRPTFFGLRLPLDVLVSLQLEEEVLLLDLNSVLFPELGRRRGFLHAERDDSAALL